MQGILNEIFIVNQITAMSNVAQQKSKEIVKLKKIKALIQQGC